MKNELNTNQKEVRIEKVIKKKSKKAICQIESP